jgi:dihydroorotate dehydrogenase (NAD+) catalytic subunit
VDIAGIRLKNPLMTASGTCGYADEYADFVDMEALGAFVTKSITPEPRQGNEYPRIAETRAGMLNAIGLANVGLDAFIKEKVPLLEKMNLPIFVNIAGKTPEDYIRVAEALEQVEVVSGCELNISCPNVKAGGIQFGVEPSAAEEITSLVKKACKKNILIVKLSPNVSDIAAIARAVVNGGADALSLINTLTGMAIDIETRRPLLANVRGGLSGPAIRPVGVYMVNRVYTEVAGPAGVPIIGMGGIQYASDAVEYLLAGATAVAIGTSLFVDPGCIVTIRDGISQYLACQGHDSPAQITGAVDLQ